LRASTSGRAQKDPAVTSTADCQLSFIVPAWNEERLLGATLDAIHVAAVQLGDAYEIVVVDDDSSDATAAIAAARGARVVQAKNRNIARTRNDGAAVARGDYLFFVDADTLVNHRVLRAALDRLHAGDVGGGAVFRWDDPHRGLGRVLELGVATLTRWAGLASGCFLYASRRAFDAAGGFDASLMAAEEWALSRALARIGPFRVLPLPVVTSGRKLAAIRLRDVLKIAARAALRGRKALREREFAHLWYTDPPR
jgi:glycosyltransferase involved in cell wall biosynthesis